MHLPPNPRFRPLGLQLVFLLALMIGTGVERESSLKIHALGQGETQNKAIVLGDGDVYIDALYATRSELWFKT